MERQEATLNIEKILLSLCALITFFAAFWADVLGPFSQEHIFNPKWPPHAKFHDSQYICMSMLLSLVALGFIWRRNLPQLEDHIIAGLILASPYLGMYAALLFPGTAMFDSEFDKLAAYVAGLYPQIWFATVILGVIALSMVLAKQRSKRLQANESSFI